ncbi:hypothetical protein RYX36_017087 [Vicia faba]
MAAAATMIGGAFLSATVQTLVEKLASTEFLEYIRNTKLDVFLLRKLQTTLLTLQAVLDDAEERQINNLAVKKWLDDLKDVVLDAEDLVNQISYDSLRCNMENTQAGSKTNQVWNFVSSPFKNFNRDINSQLKIMCETLEPFAQHKDTLGLQTKSARVSRRPPSSSGVNESVMVDCSHGGKLVEEVGDDCFAELLSRSLIQQSNDGARGKLFYMHDLINDLATSVSGKICCRSEFGDFPENVRHLSYIQEEYDIFVKFRPFYNYKCLRSFLPITSRGWSHKYLSIKVVDDLLPLFKRLRVLSLSKYTNITKLPDSIGNLVQLRYLDLSYTKIKCMPDTVCNLYNLQTLNLLCCYNLTELPVHMGNLISLRHLDISGTYLKELPMEIGGLENLQTLTVFLVGKPREGLSIKELEKFPNLQGKFTIKNLHNVVDAKEAEEANLKNKEKIEKLELTWGKESEDSLQVKVVLEMLQPPISLKRLKINLYGGTSFPNWLGNSSFSNMVSLEVCNCKYCMTLPPLGQLPSLKKLSISNLSLLETIGPEFYCVEEGECSNSTFQPFPSLEHMKFYNMPNWKDWISFESINFAFPKLRTMVLHNCPELRGDLPTGNTPYFELAIDNQKSNN